uniref:hypothetical protein n=1 Tax=Mycoplasma elephantis TaxID=114882 RepID=UPI00056BDA17
MDNNKNITNDLKRGSQSINETKINKIVKNTQNELNYTSKIKQNINNTLVTNNHIPKQNTILIPYIQVTNALPMVKSNTEKNSNNNSNHPKKGNLIKLFSFLAFFFTPLIITGVSISLFSIKSHKMNNTNLFNNQVEEYSVKNNKYSINDINDENINLVMSGLINGEKIIPQGFSASYLIIEKNKSENYIKVLVNLINKNDEIYNKTCIIKGFNTKEY